MAARLESLLSSKPADGLGIFEASGSVRDSC